MTARETFEQAREAARRIEQLQFELELAEPPRRATGGPSAPGNGDPTARSAEWRVDALADKAREMEQLQALVGEALRVIEGVRSGLGERYAMVLERHYIDRAGWTEIADETGVTSRTLVRWRDVACDWVDSVGHAHARIGTHPAKWDEFTP